MPTTIENKRETANLPSALDDEELSGLLESKEIALFLDYDGTLTEIVDDPAKAILSEETRTVLRQLSSICTVAMLSGRDVEDVMKLVDLKGITFAGSHGFDIITRDGRRMDNKEWLSYLSSIDRAEKELRSAMKGITGVKIERKRFAIAVHYRGVKDSKLSAVRSRFSKVASSYSNLKRREGKKVYEVLPNVKWDKGMALRFLLGKVLHKKDRVLPVFIGDDLTDEDAFKVIRKSGVGILVVDEESKRDTYARYTLRSPKEVRIFLSGLVQKLERKQVPSVWSLQFKSYVPTREGLREALCTTGNGYFATRGAAPESKADGIHYPGTYIAGCYNRLESKIKGRTLQHESLVNAPNWLPLTFRIGRGKWFDIDSVEILEYDQKLDVLKGILTRKIRFKDRTGRITRLLERRLVHMEYPHLAGLETTIQAENWKARLTILSALDGTIQNKGIERYEQLNSQHLEEDEQTSALQNNLMHLSVVTTQSKIRISESARTRVAYLGRSISPKRSIVRSKYVGQQFSLSVRKQESVTIEKIVSLYTSKDLAISDCGLASRESVLRAPNFSSLVERQTLSWDNLWRRFRIKIQGDARAALDIHVLIFHLLQTVSPNIIDRDAGAPARGLHGEAYRGHILWDELFILPFLNLHIPDLTRSLLMYRYRRLAEARTAARKAGFEGAMYPWQSGSNGREESQVIHLNPVSKRWIPDNSHLQRHVGLAIAYNVWSYYQISKDIDFLTFYGAEMLIEISRFFACIARYSRNKDRYEIRGVMGPDEFHDAYPGSKKAGLNNNAYTNVMVVWVLRRTLETINLITEARRRALLERLALKKEELLRWEDISRKIYVPFHEGIISQFEGYEKLKEFDWEGYKKKYGNIQRLDRILESEDDSPNNYKLSKQADVLMLFFLLSSDDLKEIFSRLEYDWEDDTFQKNIEYYVKRTSHGSTLSRIVHSWVLARIDREQSWQICKEALESDLSDIQGGTTAEGIHLGAMAGSLGIFQRCYTGLVTQRDTLSLDPVLPDELKHLNFSIWYREHLLTFDVTPKKLEIKSAREPALPIKVRFPNKSFELKPGETRTVSLKTVAQQKRRRKKRSGPTKVDGKEGRLLQR